MAARLRCVTITGADDAVDPAELVSLSRQYPFVEWGLLQSPKRVGTARYPSRAWETLFALEIERAGGRLGDVRLAHHLCGQYARDAYAGDERVLCAIPAHMRVQINGLLPTPTQWARGGKGALQLLGESRPDLEIILQVGGPQTLGTADIMAAHAENFSALLDASGGEGKPLALPPQDWVRTCSERIRLGFAGGIGPDNVVTVLERLLEWRPRRDFWIDMESGVRTNDVFDLFKMRRVLWLCAPFFAHQEQEAD